MLYLIIAISMMYALPGYATTWEEETGPYPTTVVSDTDLTNSLHLSPQTLRSNTHPLAVFCVGTAHIQEFCWLLANLASHVSL